VAPQGASTSTVYGYVYDAYYYPFPDVFVYLESTSNSDQYYFTLTDSDGYYELSGIPYGSYYVVFYVDPENTWQFTYPISVYSSYTSVTNAYLPISWMSDYATQLEANTSVSVWHNLEGLRQSTDRQPLEIQYKI
jgi:hypothetical protein